LIGVLGRIVLTLCTLQACVVGAARAGETRLWIGVEGANAPFHFVNRERKLSGMEVEIAEEICRRLLRTCVFRITEWEDLKPALLGKRIDLIASSLEIPRRAGSRIVFSHVIYTIPWAYVARLADKHPAAVAADPAGLRVGFEKYGPAGDFLARRAPSAAPVPYTGKVEALLDLLTGRIDLVLIRRDHAAGWLNDTPEGACCRVLANAPADLGLTGRGVGFAMRAGESQLAAAVDGALDAMRDDGALAEIIRRWLLFPVL
jgi:polar amino acid transport system substrate-binding protein